MGVDFIIIFLFDDDDAADCLVALDFPFADGCLFSSDLLLAVSDKALTFAWGSSFGGDSDLRFCFGFFSWLSSSLVGRGLTSLLALAVVLAASLASCPLRFLLYFL